MDQPLNVDEVQLPPLVAVRSIDADEPLVPAGEGIPAFIS
jgi:hypothetical protein